MLSVACHCCDMVHGQESILRAIILGAGMPASVHVKEGGCWEPGGVRCMCNVQHTRYMDYMPLCSAVCYK
jgi:hypothetical protein